MIGFRATWAFRLKTRLIGILTVGNSSMRYQEGSPRILGVRGLPYQKKIGGLPKTSDIFWGSLSNGSI